MEIYSRPMINKLIRISNKVANKQIVPSKINMLMVVLFMLLWASMKLSLPVLPSLEHVFDTSIDTVKMSVSLFFISFAVSQLIWATFSEIYGRRAILLIAIAVAILGTVFIIFSFNMTTYMIGRCIEGIGMGALSPVGRAVLGDIHDKKSFAQTIAVISGCAAVMPAIAPIIGGIIVTLTNWRVVFIFFCLLITIFNIKMFFYLPETFTKPKHKVNLYKKTLSYFEIARQKEFWGPVSAYSIFQGTLLGYYGSMPFWYVSEWGISDKYYAYLAIFTVIAYLVTLFTVRSLINKFKIESILRIGLLFGFGVAVLSFCFSLFGFNGVWSLVFIMTLFAIGSGIVFPSSNALLMHKFHNHAAMASAVCSTIVFGSAAIYSLIESHLNVSTDFDLSIFLIIVTIIALSLHKICSPKKRNSNILYELSPLSK